MTRLIDADALKKENERLLHCDFPYLSEMTLEELIDDAPTIDAVPLDGSFLKMSRGDYLIYKRHWLYEHFDQEIDIQRSAMKSMGYEPALKDAVPQWIPCSERLPNDDKDYLVTDGESMAVGYYRTDAKAWDNVNFGWLEHREETCGLKMVIAWMPLPEPYEGDKE